MGTRGKRTAAALLLAAVSAGGRALLRGSRRLGQSGEQTEQLWPAGGGGRGIGSRRDGNKRARASLLDLVGAEPQRLSPGGVVEVVR
jgi:hypothetical protein